MTVDVSKINFSNFSFLVFKSIRLKLYNTSAISTVTYNRLFLSEGISVFVWVTRDPNLPCKDCLPTWLGPLKSCGPNFFQTAP